MSSVISCTMPACRYSARQRWLLWADTQPGAEQGGAQGCEDWDLTLRIAEKYAAGVVPRYLVDYREVPSGMSFGEADMAASFVYLQKGLRRRNPHLLPRLHRWAGGFIYLYLARKSHQAGRAKEARRYLRRAAWTDPAVIVAPPFFRILLGSRRRRTVLSTTLINPPVERIVKAARTPSLAVLLWSGFSWIERHRWHHLGSLYRLRKTPLHAGGNRGSGPTGARLRVHCRAAARV
jgi:hypothetical protein